MTFSDQVCTNKLTFTNYYSNKKGKLKIRKLNDLINEACNISYKVKLKSKFSKILYIDTIRRFKMFTKSIFLFEYSVTFSNMKD